MKRLLSIALGLAVTFATIVIGMRLVTKDMAPAAPAPTTPTRTVTSAAATLVETENTMPASVSATPIATDPQIERLKERLGVNAETEIVEGIKVRKDRNCTIKVHYLDNGDGTTKKVHSCEPNEPRAQDIYESYSTESLESLAYSDDHAAYVLAKRLNQHYPERALKFAIRSTALSGSVEPITWITAHYHIPYSKNGVVQLKSIEDKYVLSGVAKALGDANSDHSRRRLRALEYAEFGVDLHTLDQRIQEVLAEIGQIRREVGVTENTTKH